MRTILILLKKEFLQIFRNKSMLPIIFVVPVVQLLILANAASFEINKQDIHVIDWDKTSTSRQLINDFVASGNFQLAGYSNSSEKAYEDFARDQADLILKIPHNFERDLMNESMAKVQVIINAINGSAAAVINGYANQIIKSFNGKLLVDWVNYKDQPPLKSINITYNHWFNPDMDYQTFMVPGILVMLVTMVGMFLASMNLVREKEMGTIDQLNVTPIQKYQFITGKLLPFWILALVELAIGLAVGKLVFDIPFVGSIWLVFLFAGLYLFVVLGFGLMISTFTNTQQQAMFISWFFMVIFILMSGLFTPIESMPAWAQKITWFNPVAYFVEVMRMVMLKGAGIQDILRHIIIMIIFANVALGTATWKYNKTAG